MKPAGLARRGLSLAVGESAYIASHPHTPDRNLKDIVVQVLIGNGTRDEITVMTFRLEFSLSNTETPVARVSEARWSERGAQWILIPPGGGGSSVPQKDYRNPPFAVAANDAHVGWIGFCLLEGPTVSLEEAAHPIGELVAVLADGQELRAPMPVSTLRLAGAEEPAGQTDADAGLPPGRVLVEGSRVLQLQVWKAFTPWRVGYPLFISNERLTGVSIVGFTGSILWNNNPVQQMSWEAPAAEASNAMPLVPDEGPVTAFEIQGQHTRTLHLPLNSVQIANPPATSPTWTARGIVRLQREGQPEEEIHYNLSDDYKLEQSEWDEWVAQLR